MLSEERDHIEEQRCTVCGEKKPFAAFSPKKGGGHYRRCKACEAARRRQYAVVHAIEIRESRRRLYYADIEASRSKNRAYYQAHIEKKRAQDRKRYARPENYAKRREKSKAYYAQHLEREQALGRERARRWRKAKPEQKAFQGRRRRARKLSTPGAHSEAQWRALKARYGHRCLRCGRAEPEVALTRDHVVPLGTPGASDDIGNIQPLCGPCNSWKGRRTIDFRPGTPAEPGADS